MEKIQISYECRSGKYNRKSAPILITGKKNSGKNRIEHIILFAKVAQLLLDAGTILIVTAIELTQDDLEIIKRQKIMNL